MERDAFVEKVLEYVRAKFPLVKLARDDESFAIRVNSNLASLENLYRVTELRPEDMKRHIERWIVELLRAAEGSPDQSGTFDDLKDRIYPMVLSTSSTEHQPETMITQPLVGDMVVAYGVDSDHTIAYIPKGHFDKWNMQLDELHEVAIDNLVKRSEAMNAHAAQDEAGAVNLILFQTMDGYDASRVLLPTLHDRLREYLGSPFVAGIPNRDILLCFRDDEETVGRLKQQIATDFRQMPHQVTDQLLLITPDGIALRE